MVLNIDFVALALSVELARGKVCRVGLPIYVCIEIGGEPKAVAHMCTFLAGSTTLHSPLATQTCQ